MFVCVLVPKRKHKLCLCLHIVGVCVCVWVSICMSVCVCPGLCVFPHPWTASSAWSAWSEYPPQHPCLLLSSWKQARLYAEVCIASSRVWKARTHTHTHSLALFPLLILLSLPLSSSFLNDCSCQKPSFYHPSFHAFSLHLMALHLFFSLTLLFLPTLSHSLFPTLPFSCFLLGVVASHPPSLTLAPSHLCCKQKARAGHQWFSMKSPGCWFTKL